MKEEDLRSLMFGDYMEPDAEPDERVYTEVKSLDEFYQVVEQCLDEYNNTHKNRMNLVVFRWGIHHIDNTHTHTPHTHHTQEQDEPRRLQVGDSPHRQHTHTHTHTTHTPHTRTG